MTLPQKDGYFRFVSFPIVKLMWRSELKIGGIETNVVLSSSLSQQRYVVTVFTCNQCCNEKWPLGERERDLPILYHMIMYVIELYALDDLDM